MIQKVEIENYEVLRQKFYQTISNFPLINAVLSQIQNGFVFSDDKNDVLIVVSKSGFSLVEIEDISDEKCETVFTFLQNNMDIPNYIHLYSPSEFFIQFIEKSWDKFKIRDRIQYRYKNKDYGNIEKLLPEGYSWDTIDNISFDKLKVFDLKLDSRYWNSISDFQEKAIGACILDGKSNLAAICYSACVVDGFAEMDTLVLEQYRGKGFMRIVSLPFFNIAAKNEYITHWDTFVENTASFVMGEKFMPDHNNEYKFLSILLR